jgi:hypothetical protein
VDEDVDAGDASDPDCSHGYSLLRQQDNATGQRRALGVLRCLSMRSIGL